MIKHLIKHEEGIKQGLALASAFVIVGLVWTFAGNVTIGSDDDKRAAIRVKRNADHPDATLTTTITSSTSGSIRNEKAAIKSYQDLLKSKIRSKYTTLPVTASGNVDTGGTILTGTNSGTTLQDAAPLLFGTSSIADIVGSWAGLSSGNASTLQLFASGAEEVLQSTLIDYKVALLTNPDQITTLKANFSGEINQILYQGDFARITSLLSSGQQVALNTLLSKAMDELEAATATGEQIALARNTALANQPDSVKNYASQIVGRLTTDISDGSIDKQIAAFDTAIASVNSRISSTQSSTNLTETTKAARIATFTAIRDDLVRQKSGRTDLTDTSIATNLISLFSSITQ